jgi:hypothetical protein
MSAQQREAIMQEQLGQVLARRAAAAQAAVEEAAAAAEQHRIHKAAMQQVRGLRSSRELQARTAKLYNELRNSCMHVPGVNAAAVLDMMLFSHEYYPAHSPSAAARFATGPGSRRL